MVANFCLLTCALFAAQATDRSSWQIVPRLGRGQELVYRGSYAEEAAGKGIHFSRSYRLENRIYVLETHPRSMEIALQTILKLRTPRSDQTGETEPSSVRLELARVDLQGRIATDPGVSMSVPLDGPATAEWGVFIEIPGGPLTLKLSWEVLEANRPARSWKVIGTELVNGTTCVKLEGVQQSEDWDHPRADHIAWRRRDLVWLAPRLGVAYKVERTIERREPAHREATLRSLVQYELQSEIQYPGQLHEDRRREILQAQKFNQAITPLLADPSKSGPKPFESLLTRIGHHLENQPPTPYREAVLQIKRRAEAAMRGESPALGATDERTAIVAALDQPAPDFIVTNLLTKESTQLRRWLGRPVLMVFYHPGSVTVEQVLQFAQHVQDRFGRQVAVLGFSVSDDAQTVRKQHSDLHLSLPIHAGKGLRHTYGVEATPKLVLLDAAGVVRGNYIGWGPETPDLVTEELQRWLNKGVAP
ncbi:MAG TPA: hypothetical protein VKU02_06200 [Gemmataceae bacterium]|nr:hypothetical protein [Gemmataceae bacterium]